MEHIYTWLRTGNSWMMGGGDWFANSCFLVPAFPLSVENDIWSQQYCILKGFVANFEKKNALNCLVCSLIRKHMDRMRLRRIILFSE